MKHLKLFFACLLMAVLSIGQVWAAEDEVHKFNSSNETRQVGLNNDASIDAIEIAAPSYPIKKVSVNCKYNKSGLPGVTISVTVGGNAFGSSYTFNTKETKTVDFEGDAASGAVVVSFVNNSGTGTGKGTFYVYYVELTEGASGGTPTCATPTFTPAAGSYEGTQNVTISSTADATIYYTTDESDPKTSGTRQVYSAAIPVAADMTIKAYAVKDSYNDSEVATAAYTITEGPDVTLDLIDGNWGFPTSNTTGTETYTNSVSGYSVTCYAPTNYKDASTYFFLGKEGAYIELPTFTNPIERIVVAGNSNGAADVAWNIFKGDDAVSTAASGCKEDAYTFNIDPLEANVAYRIKVTSAKNLQIKTIKIYYGVAPAVATPTISGDENFVTSTTVTLACSTTGADIYYTTDGSDPKSGTIGTSFSLTETATVRAIAKLGSDWSAEATKTFTKVTPKTTAAELRSFATSSAQNAYIQLDGWKVTFVSGNNAYIIDPSNEGVILNNASHGYVAGDELNDEVVEASVKLASGRVQLSGFTSANITATSGTVTAAEITDFSTLTLAHQSRLVTLKDATYASSTSTFSDGEHLIYFYDQFNANPTLVDGTTYDVTGVVIYYDNGSSTQKVQIAPRMAADVVAQTPVVIPTAANLAALKDAARGTYILTLTNAVVSYVNGNNAFIEDATGGALIYIASHGFTAGNCLNGDYQVTTTDHQGKFEITAIEPQAGAATTTAEIPLTTVSIATLNANFGSYESMRVKIAGANVTGAISGSDRNGEINDGAAVAVYAAAGASIITLTADDNVDIIGYPGYYNTNQQFNVWQQSDITVNEKDPAGIAFTPGSETITGGDPWSAPTFSNPNSLTVTFSGDNDAVATVNTTTGEIALAGGYGTAIITAHTDGDATHNAGNATYTITVNDPGATPVYTMSFDMTRASYDDAADAQVVWNSNVVTMTADKNDGTKVTNYLAGNYSGTTLIAETRLYAKNSISFVPQSGVTITKIEWMSTAKGYATKLAAETFVNATAVVDGTDDKLVIITPSAAGEISVTLTDAARATNVKVYYEAESEKAKLTASISIDDMNMAVGDADILLSAIAATSNPNKKAISYAVTSGTAVTIEGTGAEAALHAAAEGSATITATIPDDLGNYTGATTTFDIVVAAAPATLESIAISGTASVLEYTEGQDFNPAGLVVTGTYSDASTAPISEGITWAYDPSPLTQGTTSVSVTATVSEISSSAFVVNGLTVSAAAAPTVDNVVILAVYDTKYYAMSTTNANNGFTAIAVEYDGTQVTVKSEAEKTAIQWTRTTTGDNTTFQDADSKYMKSADGASMSLETSVCNWLWDATEEYYKISGTSRTFFFQNTSGGIFKNYAASNIGGTGYSDKAQVIVIDPANIVVTSKVSAELAYDPESDEITQGNAWSAPSLVNPYTVTITSYASDNEAVATVEGGVIALAGGIGTAHITAHFDGDASYLEGDAVYTITVNAPAPTPSGTTYTKVTSTGDITDGEYLIVYEDENVAFNGNLTTLDAAHNTVSVVISEGVIAGSTEIDNAVFTIDVANGTLRSHMGDYIGVSTYGNGLKQNASANYPAHTFAIDGDNAVISIYGETWNSGGPGSMILNYNKGVSDKRFRYYKGGSQQPIQLYKKEAAPEPPTPVYETVRDGLTAGNYYTICYPKAMTDVQGATLWSFVGRDANFAYIEQETATTIEAGKPYIMYATASTVTAVLGDETNAPGANGAIHGTFGNLTQEQLNTYATVAGNDLYLVIGNELRRVTGYAKDGITPLTGNSLPAQRAFVVVGDIPDGTPTPAPGKKVRKMPMQGQTTTGCELIHAAEAPAKMMINGQLFILRGEKKYDATGRLVK